jgi:hypothetical protein
MRRDFTKPMVFTASLLLMGVLGAVFSLILSGIIGGVSLRVAPEGSLQLIHQLICPAGSDVQYREGINRDSPSNSPTLACVSSNGTLATIQALQAWAVLYESLFVLIFFPTFLVGTILMAVIFFR